jgi:hypothetical protein
MTEVGDEPLKKFAAQQIVRRKLIATFYHSNEVCRRLAANFR